MYIKRDGRQKIVTPFYTWTSPISSFKIHYHLNQFNPTQKFLLSNFNIQINIQNSTFKYKIWSCQCYLMVSNMKMLALDSSGTLQSSNYDQIMEFMSEFSNNIKANSIEFFKNTKWKNIPIAIRHFLKRLLLALYMLFMIKPFSKKN